MKSIIWMPIMVLGAQGVFGCSDDDTSTPPAASAASGGSGGTDPGSSDIVETAVAAGSFTRLAAALEAADLVDALKGTGPFTVFAPDDDAFEAFEAANPGVLGSLSKEELTAVLGYHVVAGAAVRSTALSDGQVVITLEGSPALVGMSGGVTINDANVKAADVTASNGVIHVIDEIILPPSDDIVETAVAAGSFTTLASALEGAGLVDDLQGAGPFTVFAPTDAAFAELDQVPSGDALRNVLLYHVVSGAVGSGNLVAGGVPTLLSGKSLTVSLSGGVSIDDARVTSANILTKNGVIHVIDGVLVPE